MLDVQRWTSCSLQFVQRFLSPETYSSEDGFSPGPFLTIFLALRWITLVNLEHSQGQKSEAWREWKTHRRNGRSWPAYTISTQGNMCGRGTVDWRCIQCFSKCGWQPVAFKSPPNLLEMHIIWPTLDLQGLISNSGGGIQQFVF